MGIRSIMRRAGKMPCKLEFYVAVMGLRGERRSAFRTLTALKSFDRHARVLAGTWRQKLRPKCGDNLLCRQHLAARELLDALRQGLDKPDGYALATALALALTDRAQEIVEELDRKDQERSGDTTHTIPSDSRPRALRKHRMPRNLDAANGHVTRAIQLCAASATALDGRRYCRCAGKHSLVL